MLNFYYDLQKGVYIYISFCLCHSFLLIFFYAIKFLLCFHRGWTVFFRANFFFHYLIRCHFSPTKVCIYREYKYAPGTNLCKWNSSSVPNFRKIKNISSNKTKNRSEKKIFFFYPDQYNALPTAAVRSNVKSRYFFASS